MSSSYWKREIRRFSAWIRESVDNPKSTITFNESVDNMNHAIKKYYEAKRIK